MPRTKPEKKKRTSRKPPSNGRPRYYSAMRLSKLKPYKKNPRHNEEAVEAVVKSIEQFGKIAPIIVNEKLRICAGHTRFKAALERGEKTFPTLIVPGLTGERFKAYNIADNQTASIAQWDTPALAEIIKELQDGGFPTEMLGFAEDQLDEIMASIENDSGGLTDPDDVPDPPKKAITKRGDLWLLDDHRILCGDATSKEDMERLMRERRADLVLTDPPYGVDYDGTHLSSGTYFGRGQRQSERLNGDTDCDIYTKCLPLLFVYSGKRAAAFLFFAGAMGLSVYSAVKNSQWEVRALIIWNKNHAQFGSMGSHYKQKHEPILYLHKKGQSVIWNGDANEVTVWDYDRSSKNKYHITQKPVDLFQKPIKNHSNTSAIVLDPFLGSGTTMIAAEKLNRKCYGIEIEPIYCDVSVRRWQNFTGKKAVLIRKGKPTKITMPTLEGVLA